MLIHTIGHSTRPLNVFYKMLQQNSIQTLVDVRTMPRSRFNPQFNREALSAYLDQNGIRYVHHPDLGGLRRPIPNSPNLGWKNQAFRGYADYMQTEKFGRAIEELIELSKDQNLTVMCAEATHLRCHRLLLSDALVVRGISVIHIADENHTEPHELTSFARVEGARILYPSNEPYQPPLL